jgi:hypothetical protein
LRSWCGRAVREEEGLDMAVEDGGGGEREDGSVLGSEFVGVVVCLRVSVLDGGDDDSSTSGPSARPPLSIRSLPLLSADDDDLDKFDRDRIFRTVFTTHEPAAESGLRITLASDSRSSLLRVWNKDSSLESVDVEVLVGLPSEFVHSLDLPLLLLLLRCLGFSFG